MKTKLIILALFCSFVPSCQNDKNKEDVKLQVQLPYIPYAP